MGRIWHCPSSTRTGTGHPWGGSDGSWLERRVSQPGDALPGQGLETVFGAGGTAGLAHLSCPHELSPYLHALPLSLGTQTRWGTAPRDSHHPRGETHRSPQPLRGASM